MTKGERMKEIAKASPDFGKRVGYRMCVVDEFHDMKELLEENAELNKKLSKAETDYDEMFWNKNEIISKAKEYKDNTRIKDKNTLSKEDSNGSKE